MLTILTWYWAQRGGRTKYTAHHVNIWASMVRKHLKMPHRIACVTDMPDGIDPTIEIIAPPHEFEDVRLPSWKEHRPQCLRRLSLFRPDAAEIFGTRFVSMDLDCVIGGPLDPLFNRSEDFVMFRPSGSAQYNGSMVMMTAGARSQVYHDFTSEAAIEAGKRFVGSDQAWITHCLGTGEATWSAEDGVVRWWEGSREPLPAKVERILFFVGAVKPWDKLDAPHIARHYQMTGRRRGLILGRGPNLWPEVEAALDSKAFDGVIVLRGTDRHWPGEIDALASDDAHATMLASMLGFSQVTFCGRTPED